MNRCSSRSVGVGALLAGLLLFSPVAAQANQINFLQVGHGSQVSISGVRSGTFMAGELNWSFIGTAPAGFAQDFYSYCIDVAENLADPQTVTVTSTEGFTNGVPNGGAKAAWLYNTYAAGIRANTNVATANIQAAALQVAIWEAMYDTSNNLSAGGFILNTSGSIRSQAQTYLTALYGAGGGNYFTSVGTVLQGVLPRPGQDQLVSRVSEPSTLLLMGVAFLVFARRTRRATTTVR